MKQVLKGLLVVGLLVALIFGALYMVGYSHSSGNVTTPSQLDWEHYFQEIMKQVYRTWKATTFRWLYKKVVETDLMAKVSRDWNSHKH